MSFAHVKYIGTTPGNDSNVYSLFNSIVAGMPGFWPSQYGVFKIVIDIKHDQAGTLKWYKNMGDDNSTGWVQMGQLSVSAPASTAGTQAEVFCEAERQTKVEWTNGGTIQASFAVDVSLSSQRAQI